MISRSSVPGKMFITFLSLAFNLDLRFYIQLDPLYHNSNPILRGSGTSSSSRVNALN